MTAFAQTATTGAPATTTGGNPAGRAWQSPGGAGADPEMALIHAAIREAEENPALLPLLSQALTDRTALLNSELNTTAQLQALITAIQGGNTADIKTAWEAVRTARETVEGNAKTFREACRAVRQQMRHRPRREPPTSGGTPGATGE
jgi:hypothetical protein